VVAKTRNEGAQQSKGLGVRDEGPGKVPALRAGGPFFRFEQQIKHLSAATAAIHP